MRPGDRRINDAMLVTMAVSLSWAGAVRRVVVGMRVRVVRVHQYTSGFEGLGACANAAKRQWKTAPWRHPYTG